MKPQTAWAIVHTSTGRIVLNLFQNDDEARQYMMVNTGMGWDEIETLGYRAVRVRIEVIEQECEG